MTSLLSPERAREILGKMPGQRVVVVGDLMLDRFLWGGVDRISPEAPVPIVHLRSETAGLGGAGNVARNLHALGGEVNLVGVAGEDDGARLLLGKVEAEGLSPDGIIQVKGRTTTVKTRVMAHQQQVVRIDRETTDPLSAAEGQALAKQVLGKLRDAQALLISDYDKGVLSPELLREVLAEASSSKMVVAIDPKPVHFEHYRPATLITPNAQEARVMAGMHARGPEAAVEAARKIRKRLDCDAVLLTQGERGMTLLQADREPLPIPTVAREVFDVTGAGDTVVSVATLALAAGASLEESAILANVAAGRVVGKLGTAVVDAAELLQGVTDLQPESTSSKRD